MIPDIHAGLPNGRRISPRCDQPVGKMVAIFIRAAHGIGNRRRRSSVYTSTESLAERGGFPLRDIGAMLLSHRRVRVRELGAAHATHAVVHSRYRVHVVDNARIVAEDRLFAPSFPRRDRVRRPVATVLLDGRARISGPGGDHWLEPGSVTLIEGKGSIRMRQEGMPSYRSVSFEWDREWMGGSVGGVQPGSLDPAALERVRRIGELIARSGTASAQVAAAVAELSAILRANGVPLEHRGPGELLEPVAPRDAELSHALDAGLSNLTAKPMLVDLRDTLDVGARQLNRLVASFNKRYGFNAGSWQDTRTRRRLMIGANLMTAPGATTELVARAVGYGSAAAFCHALAAQGLPSPGALARHVSELA